MEEDERKKDELDLDFEHAEFDTSATAASACNLCEQNLIGQYYGLNGKSVCLPCLDGQRASRKGSFVKALLLGGMAGAVGAAGYWAIKAITGLELAIVTIVVGVIVGLGVRAGAGGSTSVMYRLLAVGIAWTSMCATYVPDIMEGGDGVVVASIIALILPILMLTQFEVLGVLIFGFGIWEAWKLSAPEPFEVHGPYEAAATAPEAAVAAVPVTAGAEGG